MITWEARCLRCGETFNPMDADDLEHCEREDGVECGGQGEMLGYWGADEDVVMLAECSRCKRRTLIDQLQINNEAWSCPDCGMDESGLTLLGKAEKLDPELEPENGEVIS